MLTNDRPPSEEPKAKRPRLSQHWESRDVLRAINQRNATHQSLFGSQTPSNDYVKLINLMGVWPGGFCGTFVVTSPNFVSQGINAVSVSHGLSNPGLPTASTAYIPTSSTPRTPRTPRILHRPTFSPKVPMFPPSQEYSGYGYEIAILSSKMNRNHLRVLNWLLPAQILHDAKIFEAVVKSPARCCVVNSIHLYDGVTTAERCSWLVAAPHESLPLPAESELCWNSGEDASSSEEGDTYAGPGFFASTGNAAVTRKRYKWFVASPLSDAQKTLLFAKGLDGLFGSGYSQIVSELPNSFSLAHQRFEMTGELSKIFDYAEDEISSKILTKEEESSLFSNLPYDYLVANANPQQVKNLTKYLDSFLDDDDDDNENCENGEHDHRCGLPPPSYLSRRSPVVFAGDAVSKHSVFFHSLHLHQEIFPILNSSKLPHLSRLVILPCDSTLGFNELCLKEAILAQNITAVQYFLPKIYQHSSPDPESSFTFAHLAAGWGGPQVLKLFLHTFPTSLLRQQTKQGASLLHLAVEAKDVNSVSLLLEQFPDMINVGDHAGATPLHIAVVTNQPALIVKLRKYGADESVVARGVTPLELANVMGKTEAAAAFLCAV